MESAPPCRRGRSSGSNRKLSSWSPKSSICGDGVPCGVARGRQRKPEERRGGFGERAREMHGVDPNHVAHLTLQARSPKLKRIENATESVSPVA